MNLEKIEIAWLTAGVPGEVIAAPDTGILGTCLVRVNDAACRREEGRVGFQIGRSERLLSSKFTLGLDARVLLARLRSAAAGLQ